MLLFEQQARTYRIASYAFKAVGCRFELWAAVIWHCGLSLSGTLEFAIWHCGMPPSRTALWDATIWQCGLPLSGTVGCRYLALCCLFQGRPVSCVTALLFQQQVLACSCPLNASKAASCVGLGFLTDLHHGAVLCTPRSGAPLRGAECFALRHPVYPCCSLGYYYYYYYCSCALDLHYACTPLALQLMLLGQPHPSAACTAYTIVLLAISSACKSQLRVLQIYCAIWVRAPDAAVLMIRWVQL
jgi:hypothetical protein